MNVAAGRFDGEEVLVEQDDLCIGPDRREDEADGAVAAAQVQDA